MGYTGCTQLHKCMDSQTCLGESKVFIKLYLFTSLNLGYFIHTDIGLSNSRTETTLHCTVLSVALLMHVTLVTAPFQGL